MQDWIEGLINLALSFWKEKMGDVIKVITQDPNQFMGGGPWGVITSIHNVVVGVGLAMVVVFFLAGFFESAINFRDFQRPEYLIKHFIKLIFAKGLVQHSLAIMLWIFNLVKGLVTNVGGLTVTETPVPEGVEDAIATLGFFKSIPAWLIVLIGTLLIIALSFVILLQVYGRFFKVYMYAAVSPLFMASYAWEGMNTSKAFLKSFFGVCLEGLLIVVACLIYQSLQLDAGGVYTDAENPILFLTKYMAQTVFGMLVLIGSVKLTSGIVKEMIGG